MMRCQYCGAELSNENTVCPSCGELNPGARPETDGAGTKKPNGKGVKIAIACIALCIGFVIGWGAVRLIMHFSENKPDEPEKVSYTVDDATAKAKADTVVATLGDKELTNGVLQVYYWMQVYDYLDRYASSLSYGADLEESLLKSAGLDLSKPLDAQCMPDSDTTWQEYFLDAALQTWRQYQALCISAEAAGYEVDETYKKYLEDLPKEMEQTASRGGYDSVDAMLQSEMGAGCTLSDYAKYLENYYFGFQYFNDYYEKLDPTDEEIRVYFNEHDEDFEKIGVRMDGTKMVDVRHILITPEGGTKDEKGNTTYSEAEWAACQEKAQSVLDEWLNGDKTEADFAALAQEKSQDPGSVASGGLYEHVSKGNMVENFDAWCFADDRKAGDYGMVQTPFGYHIMYYVGDELTWMVYGRDNLKTAMSNEFVGENTKKYEMNTIYENIVIASVSLSK